MKKSPSPRQKHGVFGILALAMAMCLGITSAVAAAPASQDANSAWLGNLDIEQAPAQVREAFADVLSEQPQAHQVMAGTITVTNCANSGPNTLRTAVAAANSGDTIDLSQLTCPQMTLSSQITIPQATLTIKGKPGTGILNPPLPKIDGNHASRIFNHTGTGTLILEDTYLTNGYIDYSVTGNADNDGGCVYSAGDVTVKGTYVVSCEAVATGRAAGGGIYAMGNFSLGGGSIIAGNTVTGVWYGWGGGLYSGGTLTVQSSGAVVNTNTATVTSRGYARGGGVYAANGIIGSALTLSYNTVQGTGGTGSIAQEVVGGGAYVGAIWIINLTANGNHALGPNSKGGGLYVHKTSYISGSSFTNNDAGIQGGGVYTEDTATIKTSTISDNIAGSGGGIYALANLDLATSTVADNTASASNGGGIYAFNGLRVDDSNITGNHAENSRGGISAYGNIAISSSTIANNTSPGVAGAGLGSASTTNPISIVQSTIVGNESTNSLWGTGLYLLHDASIKNSTIARNFSRNTSDTRYGAGISLSSGVQLTLSSSIVSGNGLNWGNSPMNLPQPDDIGKDSGVSVAYNIIGSHNMIGYSTVTTPVDTIGQAGMFLGQTGLNALADNGGPTLTAMPGPTSLAIDNGTDNNYDCDQRHDGHARIVGFAADIGAVEVQDNENPDRIFASGFEVVSTSCN